MKVSTFVLPTLALLVSYNAKAEFNASLSCVSDSGRTSIISKSLVGYFDTDIKLSIDGQTTEFSTAAQPSDVLRVAADFAENVFVVHADAKARTSQWLELYALPHTMKTISRNSNGMETQVTFKARVKGTDPRKTNPNLSRDIDWDKQIYVTCVYQAED